MHSLYHWCRFGFQMGGRGKHKQLSNWILKPSGFKGKGQTNTCSGFPMGIRNSSHFPSTLTRPVRKLTLNPMKPVLCPAILTLPSGPGTLRATIQPTTGACGWELVSRDDTLLNRMVRLHRQSGAQQASGRNGSKASWINAEGDLLIPGESRTLPGEIRLKGWQEVLIYAVKVGWRWGFAFMVVPEREMGIIACLTKAEELIMYQLVSPPQIALSWRSPDRGDLQKCCEEMWILLKACQCLNILCLLWSNYRRHGGGWEYKLPQSICAQQQCTPCDRWETCMQNFWPVCLYRLPTT